MNKTLQQEIDEMSHWTDLELIEQENYIDKERKIFDTIFNIVEEKLMDPDNHFIIEYESGLMENIVESVNREKFTTAFEQLQQTNQRVFNQLSQKSNKNKKWWLRK